MKRRLVKDCGPPEADDVIAGTWTYAQLEIMDECFCRAVEEALAAEQAERAAGHPAADRIQRSTR